MADDDKTKKRSLYANSDEDDSFVERLKKRTKAINPDDLPVVVRDAKTGRPDSDESIRVMVNNDIDRMKESIDRKFSELPPRSARGRGKLYRGKD